MNVQFTDLDLKKLADLIKAPQETVKLPTQELYNKYTATRKLSSYTLENYSHKIKLIVKTFQFFPDNALAVEEFINNVPNLQNPNKPISYQTKRGYLNFIKILLHFAVQNYNFKDYSSHLPKYKLHDPKAPERLFKTPEEIINLLHSTQGQARLLILTLIDSACRIGELGFTPEHPGLTADRVHADQELIEVFGKTGYHKMHCSKDLCELLILNAAPSGAVFHSKIQPNGMNSDSLTLMARRIFVSHFKTGSKLGAHTIRHSVASFLADLNGSPLLVQNFLKHASVDMSMEYIHASEQRKNTMPSPLQLMDTEINQTHKQPKQQKLLISSGNSENSTELAIYDPNQEPIETVEAIPDLSDSLFSTITDTNTKVRPQFNYEKLNTIREVFMYYHRTAPLNDSFASRLPKLWNSMIQRHK